MFIALKKVTFAASLLASGMSGLAAAQPMVDFIPQSISFQKGLDDDVSGAMSQHFTLIIKNVGNTPSRYPGSIMRVLLNGAVLNGDVYGSNGVGGYNLDAPIAPGQMGLVTFALPLNTLRGCQNVAIQIDADRTYQYGGNVFTNDTKILLAVDRGSMRVCIPPIVRGRTSVRENDDGESFEAVDDL